MVPEKNASSKMTLASTKPVWRKIHIRGGTVALIGAPAGYDKLFEGSSAKVTTHGSGMADTVVLFAKDMEHLKKTFPSAVGRMGPTARLWVAYKKGDKQLHRDTLATAVDEYGFKGVGLIAVDDVWSAMQLKKA